MDKKTELTSIERDLVVEILTARIYGHTLDEALKGTDITRPTYYRWADLFENEFAELQAQAEEIARTNRQQTLAEFTDQHPVVSAGARSSAAELISKGLPLMEKIITAQPYTIKNAKGQNREVYAYPRDVIGAMKVLHALARDGLLGEVETREQKPPPPQLPFALPAELNLRKLTATAADGTTVTVERGDVLEVVDEGEPDAIETVDDEPAGAGQENQEDYSSED